jgi:hypothetical protein
MTTRLPPPTPADPDTFEARWNRSAAKKIGNDEIPHERAIGVLIVIASVVAILAAAWLTL